MQLHRGMTTPGKLDSMRAVVLEMPKHWLDERRRHGLDKRDEVWDGVLHMVPQPGSSHMILSRDLLFVLVPVAARHGWEVLFETSFYSADDNYRVPDLVIFDRSNVSWRGIDHHAEIAIEILSPNDESREKFPFYAARGVREVWLIEPTTRVAEIYWLTEQYATAHTESPVLGIRFSTVAGPRLRLDGPDGTADI